MSCERRFYLQFDNQSARDCSLIFASSRVSWPGGGSLTIPDDLKGRGGLGEISSPGEPWGEYFIFYLHKTSRFRSRVGLYRR